MTLRHAEVSSQINTLPKDVAIWTQQEASQNDREAEISARICAFTDALSASDERGTALEAQLKTTREEVAAAARYGVSREIDTNREIKV